MQIRLPGDYTSTTDKALNKPNSSNVTAFQTVTAALPAAGASSGAPTNNNPTDQAAAGATHNNNNNGDANQFQVNARAAAIAQSIARSEAIKKAQGG